MTAIGGMPQDGFAMKVGDNFTDVDYALPQEMLTLNTITVKFAARAGSVAGGIYYVRLLW